MKLRCLWLLLSVYCVQVQGFDLDKLKKGQPEKPEQAQKTDRPKPEEVSVELKHESIRATTKMSLEQFEKYEAWKYKGRAGDTEPSHGQLKGSACYKLPDYSVAREICLGNCFSSAFDNHPLGSELSRMCKEDTNSAGIANTLYNKSSSISYEKSVDLARAVDKECSALSSHSRACESCGGGARWAAIWAAGFVLTCY